MLFACFYRLLNVLTPPEARCKEISDYSLGESPGDLEMEFKVSTSNKS
jgi:hypothetical protein